MIPQHPNYPAVLSLLLASSASSASATPVPAPELADAQLRVINHRFVDSFIADTGSFMADLVGPDFLRTAGDGSWQERDAFLASFTEEKRLFGASYDQ